LSRSFLGIATFPIQQPLNGLPIQLCKKPTFPPTGVPVTINWNTYWQAAGKPANVGVLFNLLTSGTIQAIDIINSVYIDNLNSSVPIYVYFFSTGYTAVAPPNSIGWVRCITTDLNVQVFAEGLTAGNIPTTKLIFSNVSIETLQEFEQPSTQQLWLASAMITRGTTIYNTNVGVPALGDQSQSAATSFSASGVLDTLWNTPYDSGFLYLTAASIYLTQATAVGPGGTSGSCSVIVESTGAAGVLIELFYNCSNGAASPQGQPPAYLVNQSGWQLKLDATQTWRIRAANVTNFITDITWLFNYTTNPN
jgi:hypothetical protein